MIKIAVFQADATPPLGSPLCIGYRMPAVKIVAPLSARGIVIMGASAPIVICVVDWVAIMGSAHDFWRQVLARAACTTVDRVTVHTIHPHDAPGHIFDHKEMEISDFKEVAGTIQDTSFAEKTVRNVAKALRSSLSKATPVTHLGYGRAKVSQVASNRRILGRDGKVAHVRFSSCTDKAVRAMPEGLIDPWLQNLSFWNKDKPVASLTYYATHPQSFYGAGAVNPDFVGLARSIREATLPEVAHLHFDGCGGNIGAGKYNDRSPENRLILAQRLLKGMEEAWANTKKYPLKRSDVDWRVKPMLLPLKDSLLNRTEKDFLKIINSRNERERKIAAELLALRRRYKAGRSIDVSCLQLKHVRVLHLPDEMFIEYQLAAQKIGGKNPVLVAAYGNEEHAYVGTKATYDQGGYEAVHHLIAPESEDIIMETMRRVISGR